MKIKTKSIIGSALSALLLVALTSIVSCGGPQETSEPKIAVEHESADKELYGRLFKTLTTCLEGGTSVDCISELKPSLVIPLRMTSSERQKLDQAYDLENLSLKCQKSTGVCEVAVKRKGRAATVTVAIDRREPVTKLNFLGSVFSTKVRIIDNGTSKVIEICQVERVTAKKRGFFSVTAPVVGAKFIYRNGKIAKSTIYVDALGESQYPNSNCEFAADFSN